MFIVKTPEEALEQIRSSFHVDLPAMTVPLEECCGRILAESITAGEFVPDFDRSTVDGYALRAADTFGCSDTIPALLPLSAEIGMGTLPEEPLRPGSCARIPTGGALPQGADAVVMVEYTEDYGDGTIGILKPVSPGMNRTCRGEDVFPGKTVLASGRKLTPADAGALAALGISSVPVRRWPTVGILSTGDELVSASETPGPGQVRDINSTVLASLCQSYGARVRTFGIFPDQPDLLEGAVDQALSCCDLILISGGSSVGMKDSTTRILERKGEILFHGIAIKPGKPTILARAEGKPVFGLPGHPAAAFFMAQIYVRAALDVLSGRQEIPKQIPAVLTEALSSNHGRAELTAVRLRREADGIFAEPIHTKSGLISSLAGSDGYILIPRDCEGLPQGCEVQVTCYTLS